MQIVKDDIKMVYTGGAGSSTATISASENEGLDKDVEFELSTSDDSVTRSVFVSQKGRREEFVYENNGELPINVLKSGERIYINTSPMYGHTSYYTNELLTETFKGQQIRRMTKIATGTPPVKISDLYAFKAGVTYLATVWIRNITSVPTSGSFGKLAFYKNVNGKLTFLKQQNKLQPTSEFKPLTLIYTPTEDFTGQIYTYTEHTAIGSVTDMAYLTIEIIDENELQ